MNPRVEYESESHRTFVSSGGIRGLVGARPSQRLPDRIVVWGGVVGRALLMGHAGELLW